MQQCEQRHARKCPLANMRKQYLPDLAPILEADEGEDVAFADMLEAMQLAGDAMDYDGPLHAWGN